jgi:hypothetical protein
MIRRNISYKIYSKKTVISKEYFDRANLNTKAMKNYIIILVLVSSISAQAKRYLPFNMQIRQM